MSRRIEDLYVILTRDDQGADYMLGVSSGSRAFVIALPCHYPNAEEAIRNARHTLRSQPTAQIIRFYGRREITEADLPAERPDIATSCPMPEAWCAATYDENGDERIPMKIVHGPRGTVCLVPFVTAGADSLAVLFRESLSWQLFLDGQELFVLTQRETIEP